MFLVCSLNRKALFLVTISIFIGLVCNSCFRNFRTAVISVDTLDDQIFQRSSCIANPNAYYHFLSGQRCLAQQNLSCSLNEFSTALSYDVTSSYLHMQLCQIHALQGDIDAARTWCEKAVALNPSDYDANMFLSRIYGALERYSDAQQHYEMLIALYPDSEDPYLSLAALFAGQKKYRDAVKVLRHLLQRNIRSENALVMLGNLYAEMQKHKTAEKFYRKALDVNQSSLSALEGLVMLYEAISDIPSAIQACNTILSIDPDNSNVREKLASLYIKSNDYPSALTQYMRIRESKPYLFYDATMKMALICLETGDIECTIQECTRALTKNPGDDKAAYYLASAFEKKELYDEALRYFSSIPSSSWYFSNAQIHRAFILDARGQHSEAQHIVRTALSMRKDDPDLLRFLASLYEKSGNYSEAIQALKKALSLKPDDDELLFYMGVLYEKASLFDESIAVMQKILEHNPDHADALNFIGYSWADKGIYLDKAERLIKKALKLKPNDGYIVDSLGWVYFKQNKLRKAISELEKAFELVPNDSTIAEHLGDVYTAIGDIEKAREFYHKALKIDPSKQNIINKINALPIP